MSHLNVLSKLAVAALFTFSPYSFSEVEFTSESEVTRLISYAQFGKGDVFISLKKNGAKCSSGYFVNRDSVGFESLYSMLLAAYHARTPVILGGYDDKQWSGSTDPVCELYSVEHKKS